MLPLTLLSIRTILLGEEDWVFLAEIVLRVFVMFVVALVSLRLIGKRGIKQGVFELVIIITLGSAAGDPMFYSKVGLLPAIFVFAGIVGMYKLVNYLVMKSLFFAVLIEGEAMILIKDGVFQKQNFNKKVKIQEFFGDLRPKGIHQLGQVSLAIVETSGEISVYLFESDKIRLGLPILLEDEFSVTDTLSINQLYACNICGTTAQFKEAGKQRCPNCGGDSWVPIQTV